MVTELLGYLIVESAENNAITVYKDDKPFIRATLERQLSKFQMAGYWPMIRSRVEKVIKIMTDVDPDDISAFLEDINWLSGPLTHFEYVGAI